LPEDGLKRLVAEQFRLLFDIVRWLPICAFCRIMAGSASAFLLISLTFATDIRKPISGLSAACPSVPCVASLSISWQLWLKQVIICLRRDSRSEGSNSATDEPLILLGSLLHTSLEDPQDVRAQRLQTGASLADRPQNCYV